ncbi:hypothetical protein NQ314_018058 [Rhamnusium bicolor]|uniref:Uncharacterized protein n=1 Tax=Rhamnusium bicolor TaxID=1586634 RepID=A0AAV8WSP0_9CUCU|nr:hypothetical protein NQ314_018058 [Rhamnusium bicolor]
MGGVPSKTRKLTVENDDPTSVIKVSEGVVDRIRGNQLVRQEAQPSPGVVAPQQAGPFIAELKKNDEYWENRIRSLEANHKRMNEIMEQEYNKACDQVQGNKMSTAVESKPPCQDTKRAVMECYKHYPNEPMRCAKVVQAFQECVDLKRTHLIANRG